LSVVFVGKMPGAGYGRHAGRLGLRSLKEVGDAFPDELWFVDAHDVTGKRDLALRLTFEGDKIVRNAVLPGGASPSGDT
jgi:hypothetical protein